MEVSRVGASVAGRERKGMGEPVSERTRERLERETRLATMTASWTGMGPTDSS